MLFMQAFFYLNSSCQIVCVFVPVSKKRELPDSIQNIWDRLTDSYHQGWKAVKPKSILDNSYRTMPCLFKECFSKEDDKYNCKWMELIVWFYICRTVEYWSAKHWLVKRPNKRRLLFVFKFGIFLGEWWYWLTHWCFEGLRQDCWGPSNDCDHLEKFGEFWSPTARRVLPPVH